jgi:SAM-dependent methyltransferase
MKLYINSSRVYLEEFAEKAAQSLPSGSIVLDAGAGDAPYRRFFVHTRYESTDFYRVEGAPYDRVTYICDLSAIPISSQRYDLIFCSQVLEHVPEPQSVLNELFRVLKPGGELWITAPLFYEEHQIPYDFYRYTRYGLTYLIQKAGFEIKSIEWLEGYFGTLSYQFRMAGSSLPRHPDAFGGGILGLLAAISAIGIRLISILMGIWFERLDLHYKNVTMGLCKNYAVVATKPAKNT